VNNSGDGAGELRVQEQDGRFRDGISGHHNELAAPDKRATRRIDPWSSLVAGCEPVEQPNLGSVVAG